MATDKAPAFQFYPKDFLSDEDQAVMSCEQAGAYIRLICHAWNEGSIPDDAMKCARLAGSEPKRFQAHVWPSVRVCFMATEDGRLVHGRLEKEREKQQIFSDRQRVKGVAGAAARYSRNVADGQPDVSRGYLSAQPEHGSSSSVFSLQTPVKEEEIPERSEGALSTNEDAVQNLLKSPRATARAS
jgi:uncharacterized protein YdaU (DUF1376 family)